MVLTSPRQPCGRVEPASLGDEVFAFLQCFPVGVASEFPRQEVAKIYAIRLLRRSKVPVIIRNGSDGGISASLHSGDR